MSSRGGNNNNNNNSNHNHGRGGGGGSGRGTGHRSGGSGGGGGGPSHHHPSRSTPSTSSSSSSTASTASSAASSSTSSTASSSSQTSNPSSQQRGGGAPSSYRGGGGGGHHTSRTSGGETQNHHRGGGRGGGRGRGGTRGGGTSSSSGGGAGGPYQQRQPTIDGLKDVKIETVDVETLAKPTNNALAVDSLIVKGKPGSDGTSVSIVTNYFPLELPSSTYYQYDVTITPECENRRLCAYLIGQHEQMFEKDTYVYDGVAVLYTQSPLLKDTSKDIELVSRVKENDTLYQVRMKFTCTVSSTTINQSAIQLFNIMYKRALRHLSLQQIGRNHYNMEPKYVVEVPQHRVKILPGLLSTIYTSSRGLLFNADVIYKTLRTDTVLDMIYELRDKHRDFKPVVRANLRNTIVLCRYNNRTVHIDDVDFTKTPKDSFEKSGKKITYEKYFMDTYNRPIKDLNQPLLIHKSKHKSTVEYFIPELCSMTGLTDSMRSDSTVMRDLKESTGLSPDDRAKQTISFVRESAQNENFAAVLQKWGYKISPKLLLLKGRVLPSEKIMFKNSTVNVKSNASWDIRSNPIFKGVNITNWFVIAPPKSRTEVEGFVDMLIRVGEPLDIKFSKPTVLESRDSSIDYQHILRANIKNGETQLVMIVLPSDKKELYDTVKQICINQCPVPSQCVVKRTITNPKGVQSKATKIAVQIAAKLGGAPWKVQMSLPSPTMFVGMDVYHSGEIVNRKKQSVVGFAASMNSTVTAYYSRVMIQDPGKEIVEELKPCMVAALKKFQETNSRFPSQIIFYRDGVGEGQVESVVKHEINACLAAIRELEIEDCKLSFVVVLKRINTRLFLKDGEKLINPVPGTVVDTDITGPDALEFFLVSQSVTQGTATPTRYQCIRNGGSFSANFLQSITYKLCHMYFNWFGTVRVPAPCLFAHKIAFLVGQSTQVEDPLRRLNDKLFYL